MRHIPKLGCTCNNCTEARKDNIGLYCVYDQWIGGWEYTRNPRRRALKCQSFLNKKWNNSTWRNDDVMHWHYAEHKHKALLKWKSCL